MAPLDWGLGHATRCIPIVRKLIDRGAHPVIAADRGPLQLLRDEFPALPFVSLPGYQMSYGDRGVAIWDLALKMPSLLRSILVERRMTERISRELRIDAIISDQRFGVRCSSIPSILITHQVFPRPVLPGDPLERVSHHFIRRFDRCWIMDDAGAPGLAGELSHGHELPRNASYIGVHSRFRREEFERTGTYDVVAVVSGPEPQRSIFQQLLLDQLITIAGDHLLVEGLPGAKEMQQLKNVRVVPHLSAQELGTAMRSSRMVISRSGYSTLMDLVHLGQRALLVPTPGQPEQEYLAGLPAIRKFAVVQQQGMIDVRAALEQAEDLRNPEFTGQEELLERALDDLANMVLNERYALTSA